MAIPFGRWLSSGRTTDILIVLLALAVLAVGGCANTQQAIDEALATSEKADLVIAKISVVLEAFDEIQAAPAEMIEVLGEVLTLTEGLSEAAKATAKAAQKIKDAKIEDWRLAALAASEAGAGAILGPQLASQLFGAGGIGYAAFAAWRRRKDADLLTHETKRRGQAEARAATAEAKNGGKA